MNLTYRGVRYESQPAPVEPQPIPVTDLKYRGARYRRHQVAQAEALDAILTYRGAAYAASPTVASIAATPSIQEQARLQVMNQQRREKQRQLSMLSRSAAEVGAH